MVGEEEAHKQQQQQQEVAWLRNPKAASPGVRHISPNNRELQTFSAKMISERG